MGPEQGAQESRAALSVSRKWAGWRSYILSCASRPCGKRSWKTPYSEFEALSSNGLSNEAGQGGMPKQTLCYTGWGLLEGDNQSREQPAEA